MLWTWKHEGEHIDVPAGSRVTVKVVRGKKVRLAVEVVSSETKGSGTDEKQTRNDGDNPAADCR